MNTFEIRKDNHTMPTATKTTELPIILDLVSVSASDFEFATVCDGKQFTHMITDGACAIKRSALIGKTNLPKFLLDALNAPIESQQMSEVTVDSLVDKSPSEMKAIEPKDNTLSAAKGPGKKAKTYPIIEFQVVCGAVETRPIKLNAKYLKMIWSMFPACDWYQANKNMVALVGDDGIVAVLATIGEATK